VAPAPALAWARRWGVSVASLVGGLAALFVFRRGLPHVGWIVGYLLLSVLLFAVLTHVREALTARGHARLVTAGDYTLQTLFHGLLLFVLPAYHASATVTSINVAFVAALAALALLTTIDPWYRALVWPRPWAGLAVFAVATFAALNVALPLVGVPPFAGLLLAAAATTLTLAPGIRRALGSPWDRALALTAAAAVGAVALVFAGRVAVPPAPLFMAEAALAHDIRDLEPVDRIGATIAEGDLRARGLVAYTAIHAPAGLRQPIEHVWRRRGRVVETVRLSPVRGGRERGFRTWSRKTEFPPSAVGRWSVDVMTSSGQIVGQLRFRVTP
jgi:hypothetical protein